MKRSFRVLEFVTAIDCPISSRRHIFVGFTVFVTGEQRLDTTVEVHIKEIVCLLEILLVYKVGATIVEISAMYVEHSGMLFAIDEFHSTLLVGLGVHRVEPFKSLEHLFDRQE